VSLAPQRLRRDVAALTRALAARLGRCPASAEALAAALRCCGGGFRCRRPAVAPTWSVAPLVELPDSWPASLCDAFFEALPTPTARTDFLTWYLWDRETDGPAPLGWRLFLEVRDELPGHMARVARALWRSHYNVFEVLATDGREHVDLRDLVFGDEVVLHDRALACGLRRWDLLVARLVVDGPAGIVHSLHSVQPPAARPPLETLVQGLGRRSGSRAERCIVSQLKRAPDAFLERCRAVFEDCAEPPDLTNLDGDLLVDTRLYFRVVDPEHVLTALLRSPFLEPVQGGVRAAGEPLRGARFVWLREGRRQAGDRSIRPVLGTLVVDSRYLVVVCNSRERGLAFRGGLDRLLGGAAAYLSTVHADFEQQLLASATLSGEHTWPSGTVFGDDETPSAALLQVYRQWLDTPIGARDESGGLTPREAAGSGTGRWWLSRHVNRLETVQLRPGEPGVPVFFDLDVIRRVLASCPDQPSQPTATV
jgi:hypothetical protein